MGKLIDTDDLKKILLENIFWPVIVKSALEQIPEAVVRCKDCGFRDDGRWFCLILGIVISPDFGCTGGVRGSADV